MSFKLDCGVYFQDSDGDKSDDNLVVDVSNEVSEECFNNSHLFSTFYLLLVKNRTSAIAALFIYHASVV